MDTIKNFLYATLGTVVIMGSIAVTAVFGGTIVWFIWPHALPVVFPKLVSNGWILTEIPWWSAVCLTWLCGILIKTQVNKTEK